MTSDALPITPYAGSSGHSGSDTSRERAEFLDSSGKTTRFQQSTLAHLAERRTLGLTWKELADREDLHHGSASGVLSVLHKAGKVARLKETRRLGCAVYVLPEHVNGRETAPHGRRTRTPEPAVEVREVRVEVPGPERVVEVPGPVREVVVKEPMRLVLSDEQAKEVAAIRAWAEDKTQPWPGRPALLRVLDLLAETTE